MSCINELSAREVFSCKLFSVDEVQYQAEGSTFTRFVVRHPGAAVFLPVTDEGNLLMVKQFRAAVGREILEAPAGTLEQGEEPLECAKREIQEEVGVAASEWTLLGELYPTPGFCDEKQYLYLAKGLTSSQLPQDEDEQIEVVELPVKDIDQAITNGDILDGKTISIITRAKLQGLV